MYTFVPKEILDRHLVKDIELIDVVYEEMSSRLTININTKIAKEEFLKDLSDFFSKKFTNTVVVIKNNYDNQLKEAVNKDNDSKKKLEITSRKKEILIEDNNKDNHLFDDRQELENESLSYLEKIQLKELKIAEEMENNANQIINENDIEKSSFTKPITSEEIPMSGLLVGGYDGQNVCIKGEIFSIEHRKTPKSNLVTFLITDNNSSYIVKKFMKDKDYNCFSQEYKEGSYVKVEGKISYDSYILSDVMELKRIYPEKKPIRMDFSEEKRVELHVHTQMSTMDGISSIKDYIKTAHKWGHKAIALTDSGGCQAFPDALKAINDLKIADDFKVIYGLEANVFDDTEKIFVNTNKDRYDNFTIFDFETTGLTPMNSKIIEIGGVRIENGEIVDFFSELINPEEEISEFTTKLTGITNEMLEGKPYIEQVLPKFIEFIGNSVLVGHNVKFDLGFLRMFAEKQGFKITNPSIDTLLFARRLYPELGRHSLDHICKHLKVNLENHHRAIDDSKATAEIFLKMMKQVKEDEIASVDEVNSIIPPLELIKDRTYKLILLAKNQIGLRNLYKLVSFSNVKYFHRIPRIPKSILIENRNGLIIGAAARDGEIIEAVRANEDDDEIVKKISFYDYIEILPGELQGGMLASDDKLHTKSFDIFNEKILSLAKIANKISVAIGDVHFLEPHQNILRKIVSNGQKMNRISVYPDLYFRTTDEMLELFQNYGEEQARDLVINNPNKISGMIENILPIPNGTFPPIMEGSEEALKKMTYDKAHEIYGKDLPEIVERRIEKELNSIISNGYAVMYIIAQKLVKKSNDDGYLVGSRGSVGSSFVATMTGITEVNPLAPHYICGKCSYSEFIEDGEVDSGVDLPRKNCPKCEEELLRDGFNIPFEVFLGFEGDKEPDIDLNFASEYQGRAHKYTEDLFGESYVYRAGTISAIQEKTAFGYIKKYSEEKGVPFMEADRIRLAKGMTGVKRTTGQHPGGVMIVPKNKEIFDFTPIQYPADDRKKEVLTTHFDYNAISGKILKLDILGHDVPTMIKQLEELTKLNSTDIPLDDLETLKLFNGVEVLGLDEDSGIEMGTLGIPEFGTRFVMQMLKETKPETFSDLIRISGLSHGTDVWVGNARELVKSGEIPFNKVITTREDIMNTLIQHGVDNKTSFDTMERVRKGRGIGEDTEKILRDKKIPKWYIDSCNKIKYMFPKAHAVAYVMMSFRIAYYKINYPLEFYATVFSTKVSDFNAEFSMKNLDYFMSEKKRIENLGNDATAKEISTVSVLDILIEMYLRGYKLKKVDIYKSHPIRFIIDDGELLPPCICVEGLGENVAIAIDEERKKSNFMSKDDFRKRTGVNKTVIDLLDSMGVLNMTETDQLDLFNI